MQMWTVPDGVGSVQYDVVGADSVAAGGYAARLQGTLRVAPDMVLDIWVGLEGAAHVGTTPGQGGWVGATACATAATVVLTVPSAVSAAEERQRSICMTAVPPRRF